jgi:hypothetical protein
MKEQKNHAQVDSYIKTVTDKILFSEAREGIRRELLAHIHDSIETGERYGLRGEAAVNDAINRMGDPESIAAELDQIHRPQTDFILIALAITLCLGGILTLTSSGWAGLQAIWISVGLVCAVAFLRLSYRHILTTLTVLYPIAVSGILVAQTSGITFEGQPYLGLFGLKVKIIDMAACLMAISLPAIAQRISNINVKILAASVLALTPTIYFSFIGSALPALIVLVGGVISIRQLKAAQAVPFIVGTFGAGIILSFIGKAFVSSIDPSVVTQEGHTDFVLMALSQTSKIAAILVGTLLVSFFIHLVLSSVSIKTNWLKATAMICAATFGLEILLGICANFGATPMFRSGINLPFISYGGSLAVVHLLMVGIMIACLKRKLVQYF